MLQTLLRHYVKFHSHPCSGHLPLFADEKTKTGFRGLSMITYFVAKLEFKAISSGSKTWCNYLMHHTSFLIYQNIHFARKPHTRSTKSCKTTAFEATALSRHSTKPNQNLIINLKTKKKRGGSFQNILTCWIKNVKNLIPINSEVAFQICSFANWSERTWHAWENGAILG